MKYNRLGSTGLVVSDIALGAGSFGAQGDLAAAKDDAVRIIDRYLDAGGNNIDTANVYAGGRSEEAIGEAIKNKRESVIVATKVWGRTGQGPNEAGLSRHHIMRQVEASLRRLQTDYIDLYYMHMLDALTPLDESLRAFDDLVTAGKVRYIGVSNFKAWQMMKSLAISDARGWARFVAAQYQYSLITRDIEYEFIDLCLSEGVGIMPWSPLAKGFLSGKYQRDSSPSAGRLSADTNTWEQLNTARNWAILDVVNRIATERGITCTQVAIAWTRVQPAIGSVIIGAHTMEQLEDNLAAADLELTADEINELNAVSALPELYPYWMVRDLGTRKL